MEAVLNSNREELHQALVAANGEMAVLRTTIAAMREQMENLRVGEQQRIQQAEKSDVLVNIIDSADDKQGITADHPFNTWHYKAANVTDFAFATSDHYVWQSSSLLVDPQTGRRTGSK